jgi:hypothetical protein
MYSVFLFSVFDVFSIYYANSTGKDAMGNKLIVIVLFLINAYTVLAVLLIEKNNLTEKYKTFCVLLVTIPCLFIFGQALGIIANIVALFESFLR